MTGLQSVMVPTRVFDSLGNKHDVTLRLDKLAVDPTTGPPPVAAADLWQWTVTNLDPGMTINAGTGGVNGAGTGLLRMGTDGKFLSVNTTDGATPVQAVVNTSQAQVTFDYLNGAASGQKVTLDLTQITQMQDANTVAAAVNDGHETGSLLGFAIGQDGVITGSYSNGQNEVLGQIALATFANPGGLNHVSQNLFVESPNSGAALVGVAGTASRGTINAGQLEASNVDLAVQFTDMIRAERGFQANSRIITTSDEMLQDLVNLKR
jgi:flagellar hook protein FlgE